VGVVGGVEGEGAFELEVGELVGVLPGVGRVIVVMSPGDCERDKMLQYAASVDEGDTLEVALAGCSCERVDSE